jgi:hypothetical protein
MDSPTILNLNLDHFRRLLQTEADPIKRQTILGLIRETEEQLRDCAAAAVTDGKQP